MRTEYPTPCVAEFNSHGVEYRLHFHPLHLGEWERLYRKEQGRWVRVSAYAIENDYAYGNMIFMLQGGLTPQWLGVRLTSLNGKPV